MSEDTDETSFEDNYLEAVAAVRAHPGSIEHEKTLAPRTMAVGVVRPDYLELVAFLERLERDPGLSMIVASNTPQLEEAREEVHSLITRLLHNFAGSATSLVDHVRVTLDGRETPAVSSLRSGVEQLLEDGAWPFVKDLRNYIRHFRAPFLGHQVSSVETRRATFRWRTL